MPGWAQIPPRIEISKIFKKFLIKLTSIDYGLADAEAWQCTSTISYDYIDYLLRVAFV